MLAKLLIDLPPRALEPLLDEQTREWRDRLLWDYSRTARRLLFLADLRALAGLVLFDGDGGEAVGYACGEFNSEQADFSDFYVRPQFRSASTSTALLRNCIEQLPPVRRVSLSPAIPHPIDTSALPIPPTLTSTNAAEAVPVERVCRNFRENHSNRIELRPWREGDEDEASQIMPSSFTRDSGWPNQTAALASARDFVESVVVTQATFPFLPEASVTAIHRESGRICGFLLANHAMEGVAYANFLCVAPWVALHRLGDRLSVEHCLALARLGYHTVTLRRRTTDPRLARFYARMGFVRQFDQISYEWTAGGGE